MLTMQLRELEEDGIIERKVYAQVPPKVEYSISKSGETLKPIVDAMWHWGRSFLDNQPDDLDIDSDPAHSQIAGMHSRRSGTSTSASRGALKG